MATFRERLLAREFLLGTFLNTGSAVAAEICAGAGFDWVLVDLVRVEANERARFTKVLDFGAEGAMVPRIESAAEARRAISHLRYAPDGVRGVALMNRFAGYGARGRGAIDEANERVVGVVQIESERAVAEADAVAAVDGVDCLFVGPSDLTHSLGIFLDVEHGAYVGALEAVRAAADRHRKALGVLVRTSEELDRYRRLGFTFVAFGSDTSFLAAGARAAVESARGS